MKTTKLMTGLVFGAVAGGMVGAIMDKKNSHHTMMKMGRKMLKKCTGIVSDLL